jgi:predicted helicase
MYAQTVIYGLFAARAAVPSASRFTRPGAAGVMPDLPPLLRGLFEEIASPHLDVRLARVLDECSRVLAHTDLAVIFPPDAEGRCQAESAVAPLFHFYDRFLAAYHPALRDQRGVYATPEPVVSYLVRSVDHVLREWPGCPAGLADERAIIVDPATGTAPFLCAVVQHVCEAEARRVVRTRNLREVVAGLLPRLVGFEVLVAPYAAAHLNLGLLLRHYQEQEGGGAGSHESLNISLVNALADEAAMGDVLAVAGFSAEAGRGSAEGQPVLVVLGNPPYSYQSAGGPGDTWMGTLIRDYYTVDGKPLGERNPKGLQDDYVKFFRLAQWLINQAGAGVLAYVCNHSYLDNPTFRGMRQQLLREFDAMFILNLHGHSKRKEHAPGGLPDENVFDIRQGVAIGLFVKQARDSRDGAGTSDASVWYADLWGSRSTKFATLREQDVQTTPWQALTPSAPWYLLMPHDTSRQAEYGEGWKVTDLLPVHRAGLMTARDALTVWGSHAETWHTVCAFAAASPEAARTGWSLGKDTQEWQVMAAQEDVRASGPHPSRLTPLLYRPFDVRSTYYTGRPAGFHSRPRASVMQHMHGRVNLGLVTVRQVAEGAFTHLFVTDTLVECRVMLSNKGYGYLFPLYLYPPAPAPAPAPTPAPAPALTQERRPNLSPAFMRDLEERLGLGFVPDGRGDLRRTVGPEDVFHYLYALLHSATYRQRYAAFLTIDFPRVFLTRDWGLFAALAEVGAALVDLHLLRVEGGTHGVGGKGGAAILTCPEQEGVGSHRVGEGAITMVRYDGQRRRVLVGEERYVSGVEPETWEVEVGGYQPLAKWLKDRKGQTLQPEEVRHYLRMVIALRETRRLVGEIETLVSSWPVQ